MDLILVEDEKELGFEIQKRLQEESIQVDWVFDPEKALQLLKSFPAGRGLLVLDRLVGPYDLIEQIPSIRKKDSSLGILVLSAINSPIERAQALENGADDYLSKPFSMAELVARVRALERRVNRLQQPQVILFGDIRLEVESRVVAVKDQKVNLTNKEYLLLKLLLTHPGRILSKNQIYERVWDINSDFETNVIESTVNSLRRKLEVCDTSVRIKNTRNVGYWVET